MTINRGDKTIHTEWRKYYEFLEVLRLIGIVDAYESSIMLQTWYGVPLEDGGTVFSNWKHNYEELRALYGWA